MLYSLEGCRQCVIVRFLGRTEESKDANATISFGIWARDRRPIKALCNLSRNLRVIVSIFVLFLKELRISNFGGVWPLSVREIKIPRSRTRLGFPSCGVMTSHVFAPKGAHAQTSQPSPRARCHPSHRALHWRYSITLKASPESGVHWAYRPET